MEADIRVEKVDAVQTRGGNTRYVTTCRRHFKEALAGKPTLPPTILTTTASPFPRSPAP